MSASRYDPSNSHVTFHDSTFKTAIDFAVNGHDDNQNNTTHHQKDHNNQHQLPKDFDISSLFTLPTVVNFVALRETFLSEAPFIRKNNRAFWKKWIDSIQYFKILSGSLRLISDSILENGVVLADKLYQIDLSNPSVFASANNETNGNAGRIQNPLQTEIKKLLLNEIAISITEMLMLDRNKRIHAKGLHDILFDRLPELLVYMTVHSLFNTMPKLSRVFYSIKFRELLVDWFNELIFGWRLTSNHHDCEWLYREANEISIMIVNQPMKLSQSLRETKRLHAKTINLMNTTTTTNSASLKPHTAPTNGVNRMDSSASAGILFPPTATTTTKQTNSNNDDHSLSSESTSMLPKITRGKYGTARSRFHLKNSPLVSMYLNMGRKAGGIDEEDWREEQGGDEGGELHSLGESLPTTTTLQQHQQSSGGYYDTTHSSECNSHHSHGSSSGSSYSRKHHHPLKPPASYVCQHSLSLGLSHIPNRPIVSMQMNIVQEEHKFRSRIMTHDTLKQTLENTANKRMEILQNKQLLYDKMRQDVEQMNAAFEIQLAILQKKPVSQKQMLAAATAMEQVKLINNNTNAAMSSNNSNNGNNNIGNISSNSSVNVTNNSNNNNNMTKDDDDSLMDGR